MKTLNNFNSMNRIINLTKIEIRKKLLDERPFDRMNPKYLGLCYLVCNVTSSDAKHSSLIIPKKEKFPSIVIILLKNLYRKLIRNKFFYV